MSEDNMKNDNMKNEMWLYLSPTVARQFTKKDHILIDPNHINGIRSNPDMFPFDVASTRTARAYTCEGIDICSVPSYAYETHVKKSSIVGGRGSSNSEIAYGKILNSIAKIRAPQT